MEDAVTLGGEVSAIEAAMRHTVVFRDLRQRLAEVGGSVKRLRADLSLVAAARTGFGLSVSPRAVRASSAAAAAAVALGEGDRSRQLLLAGSAPAAGRRPKSGVESPGSVDD